MALLEWFRDVVPMQEIVSSKEKKYTAEDIKDQKFKQEFWSKNIEPKFDLKKRIFSISNQRN